MIHYLHAIEKGGDKRARKLDKQAFIVIRITPETEQHTYTVYYRYEPGKGWLFCPYHEKTSRVRGSLWQCVCTHAENLLIERVWRTGCTRSEWYIPSGYGLYLRQAEHGGATGYRWQWVVYTDDDGKDVSAMYTETPDGWQLEDFTRWPSGAITDKILDELWRTGTAEIFNH